ncbi:MAG: hypothetical protein RIA69_08020 [Cyclobacteriaceae bacterium]
MKKKSTHNQYHQNSYGFIIMLSFLSIGMLFSSCTEEEAEVLDGLKRFDQSIEAYNIAINNHPKPLATDYSGRGTVCAAMAKKDFEKALELKPRWKRIEEQLSNIR